MYYSAHPLGDGAMRWLWLVATLCIANPCIAQTPGPAPSPAPGPAPADPIPSDYIKALAMVEPSMSPSGSAAGTLTPDLFSGTARYTISLPLPPMRGFEPPAPVLTYSSRSNETAVGFGWNFDFGSISKVTTKLGQSINYQHSSRAGAISLIDNGSATYVAEFSPPFTKYQIVNAAGASHWIAIDDKGVTYKFGQRSESRIPTASTGDAVRKWLLDEISDPNGNIVTFSYSAIGNQSLIDRVSYGAHRNSAGVIDILPVFYYEFTYEARPDKVERLDGLIAYALDKRLKTVTAYADGTMQRSFSFSYSQSSMTGRSLLSSVTEIGAAGGQRPPAKFEYHQKQVTFSGPHLVVPANIRKEDGLRWTDIIGAQIQIANLKGGAIPKFCVTEASSLVCREMDGVFQTTAERIPGPTGVDWPNIERSLIRLVDLRGTGRPDICLLQDAGLDCWINEGTHFTAWPGPKWSLQDPINSTSLRFGDVNGDGYQDVCRIGPAEVECVPGSPDGFKLAAADLIHGPPWSRNGGVWSQPSHYSSLVLTRIASGQADDVCGRDQQGIVCFAATATGFDLAHPIRGPDWSDITPPDATQPADPLDPARLATDWAKQAHYGTIGFIDFENKGASGVCGRDRDRVVCYRNIGGKFDLANPVVGPSLSGTTEFPSLDEPFPQPSGWAVESRWRSISYVDVNGDGKADICARDASGFQCWLSGSGIFNTTSVAGAPLADNFEGDWLTSQYFSTLRMVDVRGTGHPDLCGRTNKGLQCWFNEAAPTDLLRMVTSPNGGTTELDYESVSRKEDRGMPIPMTVLSTIKNDYGRGSKHSQTFQYKGGLIVPAHKDFRGFREVLISDYGSSVLVRRQRQVFSQATAVSIQDADDLRAEATPMKGRLLAAELISPDGQQIERTNLGYQVVKIGSGSAVYNTRSETVRCMPDCMASLISEFDFDASRGTMTEQRQLPATGRAEDQISKSYTYALDGAGQRTTKISKVQTFRGVGTRVLASEAQYGYDEKHGCDQSWLSGRTGPNIAVSGPGNVTSIWKFGADVDPAVILSDYDPLGNVVCASTPGGGLVKTIFDSRGIAATKSINALGHVTLTEYNGLDAVMGINFGSIARRVAPNGAATSYQYDEFGRAIRISSNASSRDTIIEYKNEGDPRQQHVRVTSPGGLWREIYVDGASRRWKTVHPNESSGHVTEEIQFDAFGRPTDSQRSISGSPSSITSSYTYDYKGRILKSKDASGKVTERCYFDATETHISSDGRRLDKVSDALGRVVSIVEYEGSAVTCSANPGIKASSTVLEYDALFGLRSVSNGRRTIRLTFDAFGRKKGHSDSWLGDWHYIYAPSGLLQLVETPDGQKTVYEHDVIGRPLNKKYHSSSGAVATVRFQYDATKEATGFLSSVIDASGTQTRLYDQAGRMVSTLRTVGDVTHTLSQTYDNDDNITDRVFPDGHRVHFSHTNGYLTSIEDNAGPLITYSQFDELGRPRRQVMRNGIESQSIYSGEDNSWCPNASVILCGIDLKRTDNGSFLWSTRRSIDSAYRVNKLSDSEFGTVDFKYDERGRLREASRQGSSPLLYSYDDDDNVTRTGRAAQKYDHRGRLTKAYGRSVEYDSAGRVIKIFDASGVANSIRYGTGGRPSEVVRPDGRYELKYDDDGNLVSVRNDGKTYVYSDGIAVCDGKLRCTNSVVVGGSSVAEVDRSGSRTSFVQADLAGSLRMMTDERGRPITKRFFGPYGERLASTGSAGSAPLELGFVGGRTLPKSGLTLFGTRLYDAGVGRFLQPDSAGLNVSLLRRNNPYSYAFNNPLIYRDPNGECPICIVIVVGALLGAANAAIHDRNILEGALLGAAIAAGGYTVGLAAAAIGAELGVSVYVSAAIGQGLYSGMLAAAQGQEFGPAFGRGALTGLVSAGIGRGTMEVVPTPDSESFAGALARQSARDAIRGAASSVVVGAIYKDRDLGSAALRGAMYAVTYNYAQTTVGLIVGAAVADSPPVWSGHAFLFPTNSLPSGTEAMTLGMAILIDKDIYDDNYVAWNSWLEVVPRTEKGWVLLQHEQGHVWQYNVLGANFFPSYFSSIFFGAQNFSDLQAGGNAYRNSDFENMQFGPSGAPGVQNVP